MADFDVLRKLLAQHSHIRLAIVFGSVATGRAGPRSDLDIGVLADGELDAEAKMALIGDLAEATGRAVDLVDLRRAGEPLLGQILKGTRVIGSDTEFAELALRHIYANEDFMPYIRRTLEERRRAWIG